MKFHPFIFFCLIFLNFNNFSIAQENAERTVIKNYLQKNQSSLGLNSADTENWIVTNRVFSESTGITSIYIQQTIQDIPVHNAVANVAVKEAAVFHFADRLIRQLDTKASGATPSLNPTEAVSRAAAQLNLPINGTLSIIDAQDIKNVLVSKEGLSLNDIPVRLVFQPIKNEVQLAWDMSIRTRDGKHWWSIRVDANTGEILDKNDWILTCHFPKAAIPEQNALTEEATRTNLLPSNQNQFFDGSQYNVFAFPTESPSHGSRTVVTDPANADASPFGWHDTDGVDGPEHTITRGNNVWAMDDFDGNDDIGYSPDGSASLNFDYYYNNDNDPVQDYEDAAITNLFYVNNMMHDVWYQYGFDEISGNFQETNYSGDGLGNDFVYADAQDGSGFNNAVFGTPPDGDNPVMQMFLWNPVYLVAPLTVHNSSMAGNFNFTDNIFDPGHIDVPLFPEEISGNLVLAQDGTADFLGCNPLTNASEMNGNIAVIRRGTCTFASKVLNAQNAGAIAVIIVNNEGGEINMGGGDPGIQIPAVSVTMATGEDLISAMENTTIQVSITNPHKQLLAQDGSFDNLIVSHEYGHGISTRLTGGASNADCLYNDEQMGEGWSDWFGLMLTLKEGDVPTAPRGVGTYVSNQSITGNGIRNAPYSTSFGVNNYTYNNTNNAFQVSSPHGIGFVWSTILWDMTWALIDDHGFDPDLYNGTGGNNIAMQLVIDGLKLQPCNPGFVDGRDAILAADMAITGGENQCTIWQVFANRGVGYSASQGSSYSRSDQTEAFDLPPAEILANCAMSVENFEDTNGIQIFPNPNNGIINVSSTLQNASEGNIQVFDMNGRLVLSQQINLSSTTSIDAGSVSAGVYVVKITAEGTTTTQKLIME